MLCSASLTFYGCLLLSMVTIKLGLHAPSFLVVTVLLLWVAYRKMDTPGWPAAGELSAASIIAIALLARLPSALGLV